MKAVVLVGGEGTRLRPLTETIPKPLVHFMNRPFLDHILDYLARHGVGEVICSSAYLESEFHAFLETRKGKGPAVTWITEAEPLGTAGAIAGALGHLEETFLALNGDVLTDLDLGAMIAFHLEREAVATVALTPVEDARPFGLVETAPDGRVVAFREKPEDAVPGTINAGTYVLEPGALDEVARGEAVSIERETYPNLIARGEPVYAYLSDAYWMDLGTPAAYVQGHIDALDGLIEAYRGCPRPFMAGGASIDPDAEVGPHVVLGEGARIEAGAKVERSVLHRGAVIGRQALVEGSILGPESAVHAEAVVRDAVLAEGAGVATGARVEGIGLRPRQVASS